MERILVEADLFAAIPKRWLAFGTPFVVNSPYKRCWSTNPGNPSPPAGSSSTFVPLLRFFVEPNHSNFPDRTVLLWRENGIGAGLAGSIGRWFTQGNRKIRAEFFYKVHADTGVDLSLLVVKCCALS